MAKAAKLLFKLLIKINKLKQQSIFSQLAACYQLQTKKIANHRVANFKSVTQEENLYQKIKGTITNTRISTTTLQVLLVYHRNLIKRKHVSKTLLSL